MVEPELLNNTLWDERDLINSSSERVIFPETCVLTDHIMKEAHEIVRTSAMEARESGRHMKDVLMSRPE